MYVHNKNLGLHDQVRNSLVVTVRPNQHACAASGDVRYGNSVLKLSTFSLAEDYLISCSQANLLSLLEKLITMVTKNTEKTELQEGRRNTEEVASSVIFRDPFRVICRHDSVKNNPL